MYIIFIQKLSELDRITNYLKLQKIYKDKLIKTEKKNPKNDKNKKDKEIDNKLYIQIMNGTEVYSNFTQYIS